MAKTLTVERSATINAPPERVYALIEDLRQWERWSPWEELDPDMQHTYSGAERGVGAVHEWKGNKKAGEGRMRITEAESPRHLGLALTFIKPFKSENTTSFDLTDVGGSNATNVKWSMQSPQNWMMRVMDVFMNMDKRIGNDFEKGLAKLSTLAQSA